MGGDKVVGGRGRGVNLLSWVHTLKVGQTYYGRFPIKVVNFKYIKYIMVTLIVGGCGTLKMWEAHIKGT